MTVNDRVEEIYAAERDHIYAYLLYFSVPAGRAQELAQDAFLKLYLKMSKGESIENPRAWLYKVAHNSAQRFHQRELVFDELVGAVDPADRLPDPESAAMERQRKTALLSAIRDLSPRQRNCLHLRAQGLRHRQIADVIGISTSAATEFLRRAAVRLKGIMDGY